MKRGCRRRQGRHRQDQGSTLEGEGLQLWVPVSGGLLRLAASLLWPPGAGCGWLDMAATCCSWPDGAVAGQSMTATGQDGPARSGNAVQLRWMAQCPCNSVEHSARRPGLRTVRRQEWIKEGLWSLVLTGGEQWRQGLTVGAATVQNGSARSGSNA